MDPNAHTRRDAVTSACDSGPCLALHSIPPGPFTVYPGLKPENMPCFFFSANSYANAGSGACFVPHGPAKRSREARSAGSTQNCAISSGVGGTAGGGARGAAQPASAAAATARSILEDAIVTSRRARGPGPRPHSDGSCG